LRAKAVKYKKAEIRVAVSRKEKQGVN
jgi:hypothetical protein